MVNSNSKKADRSGKTLPILGAVFAVLVVVMLAALYLPEKNAAEFTPPPFEENAMTGVPEVPEDLGYSSPYKEGMAYHFSICGNVTTEGKDAVVYLTNPAENEVWLKLRILDESGKSLGETGLIKPGEYVRGVTLTTIPKTGSGITLKIMGYEPDTYRSAGSALLHTVMRGTVQ